MNTRSKLSRLPGHRGKRAGSLPDEQAPSLKSYSYAVEKMIIHIFLQQVPKEPYPVGADA